tara:strand:+ start:669 stop:863 length:195 start_codon:yes stop_codon:yes gene_type:complete
MTSEEKELLEEIKKILLPFKLQNLSKKDIDQRQLLTAVLQAIVEEKDHNFLKKILTKTNEILNR